MRRRSHLASVLLALAFVVAACGGSVRAGPGGEPPLAPQDAWARQRVDAVLQLYSFSHEGMEAARGLRVLHVLGRPGWFGSTGPQGFVGIGQASPSSIVHEMSHSLCCPLPAGPSLDVSVKGTRNDQIAPALQALRHDLEAFLQQPPDAYEPLRARLRLIPDLITGAYPGLYHLGEAEIIHFTGGDLDLVPPLLRKYYRPLLAPGQFQTWDEAVQWYLRLPDDQRRTVDAYLDVGDVRTGSYPTPKERDARVDPDIQKVILQEERQRLLDFFDQFDLYFKRLDSGSPLVDDPPFWRGYLREISQLLRIHPEVVSEVGAQGGRVARGLRFLVDVAALPKDQRPAAARERIVSDPFRANFLAALDGATLAAVLRGDDSPADRQAARLTRSALRPFHLRVLDLANELVSASRRDPAEAGRKLDRFLRSLDSSGQERMNFVLETLGEVDPDVTRSAMKGLSPEMAKLMVNKGPAFTRFLLQPEELITVLGYGGDLEPERLGELARLFNDKVSATPQIDLPFLEAVYRRIVKLGQADPRRAIQMFADTGLLIEPFITNDPREAVGLFSADTALAARVFETANPVRLPPARAIYLLARASPPFAAQMTLLYQDQGAVETVDDALMFFAYDLPRQGMQPALGISLESDVRYLETLVEFRGDAWLVQVLARAAQRYQQRIDAGELDLGYLSVYRQTLSASVATIKDAETRGQLETIVARALG